MLPASRLSLITVNIKKEKKKSFNAERTDLKKYSVPKLKTNCIQTIDIIYFKKHKLLEVTDFSGNLFSFYTEVKHEAVWRRPEETVISQFSPLTCNLLFFYS